MGICAWWAVYQPSDNLKPQPHCSTWSTCTSTVHHTMSVSLVCVSNKMARRFGYLVGGGGVYFAYVDTINWALPPHSSGVRRVDPEPGLLPVWSFTGSPRDCVGFLPKHIPVGELVMLNRKPTLTEDVCVCVCMVCCNRLVSHSGCILASHQAFLG